MIGAPIEVTYQVHTVRRRHAIVLKEGPRPQPLDAVPRVARLLALAHHFERLLAEGIVRTQGELAALAGVTRPRRVTQIPNVLLLAPRHPGGAPVSAPGRTRLGDHHRAHPALRPAHAALARAAGAVG